MMIILIVIIITMAIQIFKNNPKNQIIFDKEKLKLTEIIDGKTIIYNCVPLK